MIISFENLHGNETVDAAGASWKKFWLEGLEYEFQRQLCVTYPALLSSVDLRSFEAVSQAINAL